MALEGNLHDLPLIDLMRLFQRSERNGRLMLVDSNEWAMIWFRGGQPAHAIVLDQAERRSLATGEEALLHVLGWRDGSFRFLTAPPEREVTATITRSTSELLVASLERRAALPSGPLPPGLSTTTPLQVMPQFSGLAENIHLTTQEWLVLSQVERGASVAMVAAATGLSVELTLGLAGRLLALGLLSIAPLAAIPARRLTVEPPRAAGQRNTGQPAISNLARAIKRRLGQLSAAAL